MTDRITEKHLQAVCDRINRATGSPLAPYAKDAEGRHRAQIGNYHLSHAYGDVSLHRMYNDGGGVSDVFGCGHVSKRNLADRMHAFLTGMPDKKGTYSLAEVRNGTGWPAGARFALIEVQP